MKAWWLVPAGGIAGTALLEGPDVLWATVAVIVACVVGAWLETRLK